MRLWSWIACALLMGACTLSNGIDLPSASDGENTGEPGGDLGTGTGGTSAGTGGGDSKQDDATFADMQGNGGLGGGAGDSGSTRDSGAER